MRIWLNPAFVGDYDALTGDCDIDCDCPPAVENTSTQNMPAWLKAEDNTFSGDCDTDCDCPPAVESTATQKPAWLDAEDNTFSGDCDGDCDCDCHSATQTDAQLSTPLWDEQHFQTLVLQCAPSLHIQPCAQACWLVCSPAGTGRIAVVDAEARQLLQHFAQPTTLAHVAQAVPQWQQAQITRMATLFLALGFLCTEHEKKASAPGAGESTPSTQLAAWIHLTNACNLRCSYCYLDKTSEHMEDETVRRSIDAVFRSARKHGMRSVKLKYAGGEASLHMRNVLAVHDYAVQVARDSNISLKAVILSNGVALSQRVIDALKERQIRVMISLDGLEAFHDSQRVFANGRGSFRYVLRTIERLIASDFPPHISITVSQYNLAGLPDLMQYILEHDLSFSVSYYRENACSAHLADLQFAEQQMITAMKALFKTIEQRLPRRSLLSNLLDRTDLSTAHSHTCGVGQNYLVIDQHGGIAKCQVDIKRTITTIAADDPLQIIRQDRSGVQGLAVAQKQGCQTCEWRNWCTGGCPLLTYRATGRYDVQSPNCGIYQALFPEVVRLEALRLLRYTRPYSPGQGRSTAEAALISI